MASSLQAGSSVENGARSTYKGLVTSQEGKSLFLSLARPNPTAEERACRLYAVSDHFYSQSMDEWPEIEFPDTVNYLLLSTSKFTKEQLKAYESTFEWL